MNKQMIKESFIRNKTFIRLIILFLIFMTTLSLMMLSTYAWFTQRVEALDNIINSGQWVYKLSYNLNGGTNNQFNKDYYHSYEDVHLFAPVRQDYEFLGWYNNSAFLGNPITFISKNTRGDKELYAAWRYRATTGLRYVYDNRLNEYIVTGEAVISEDVYIPMFYNDIAVAVVEKNAFSNNNHINTVNISENVRLIDNNAFRNCSNLTYVSLPYSLLTIGNNAFNNCANLSEVIINRKHTDGITQGSSGMFANVSPEIRIYVPFDSLNVYKNDRFWKDYSDRIFGF